MKTRSTSRARIIENQSIKGELAVIAEQYENKYGIEFSHIAIFPFDLLRSLHAAADRNGSNSVSHNLFISNSSSDSLAALGRIANGQHLTPTLRREYLDALLCVYGRLPLRRAKDPGVVVAPQREGRILADLLGQLQGTTYTPHMKRMQLPDALAVGIEHLPSISNGWPGSIRIIDGAIASGVTIMSLMEIFMSFSTCMSVYAAHSTEEAIAAMITYGNLLDIELNLHVGHVSGYLNDKFYATSGSKTCSLVVGDLGDIISPLFH